MNGSGELLVLVSGAATICNMSGGFGQYGSQAKVNQLASTGVADSPLAGVGMGALALGVLLWALRERAGQRMRCGCRPKP